jgi:hypothetical protein
MLIDNWIIIDILWILFGPQSIVEGYQHIEHNASIPGLSIKQLSNSNDANINWPGLMLIIIISFLAFLDKTRIFLALAGSEAYFFTPQGQDIPMIFAADGKERMRIGSKGSIGVGDDVSDFFKLQVRPQLDDE